MMPLSSCKTGRVRHVSKMRFAVPQNGGNAATLAYQMHKCLIMQRIAQSLLETVKDKYRLSQRVLGWLFQTVIFEKKH